MSINKVEISKEIAIKLGCTPEWNRGYKDYICTCKNMEHAVDSQCSVLKDYSEHRKAYGV